MINPVEYIYNGGKIDAAKPNVFGFRWSATGTLEYVRLMGAMSGPGTALFNLRNDGTPIFAGAGRLTWVLADSDDKKEDLAIAVVEGKQAIIDLESLTGVGTVVLSPITILMKINDGIKTEEVAVVKTTASIANDASEDGTVSLGKTFVLNKISADRECRVRLYQTAAFRTADAARPVGTDPEGEHGLICDFNLTTGNLTWNSSPIPNGANGDTSRTPDIYYSIQNKSGGTSTVEVTFSVVKIEE